MKRIYIKPEIKKIDLDNSISLVMQSQPADPLSVVVKEVVIPIRRLMMISPLVK